MKKALLVMGLATATYISAPALRAEEQVSLTQGTSGSWNVDWNGAAQRTDFLQWSNDLTEWHWAPLVEYGSGAKYYGFTSSTDKYFLRLQHSYTPSSDPEGDDYDYDSLSNLDEVTLYDTNPLDWDTDGDGLDDNWEINNDLDPRDDGSADPDNGADGDPDGDGLSNYLELSHGTNPQNPHSDSDGINDGDEVLLYGSYPTVEDSDGDGLDDYDEVITYGTNPLNWDTDDDTLLDADELLILATNPVQMDSDGDWMWDDWELQHGLDPTDPSDGLLDADSDGLANQLEFVFKDDGFDPFTADAANFPWNDDPDYDGITTTVEFNTYLTNPKQPDTDEDGMDDAWEIQFSYNPNLHNSKDANPSNDEAADPDGDNISNGQESAAKTKPNDPDSDGDGVNDDVEIGQGSNPHDPNDKFPPAQGTVTVSVNFGDQSGSHSEKYRVRMQPTEGDTQVRERTNRDYGATQTDTFHVPKGAKYTVTLVHVGTSPRYRDTPKPDYDYTLLFNDNAAGILVEDPQSITGIHNESESFFASGKQATLRIPRFEWITPAGDPVNAAVDSGDGQNEFTYSSASPGILTMNLKMLVHPSGTAGITDRNGIKFADRCKFKLPTINGSTFDWNQANPDGKTTSSGEHLIAAATYTSLPPDYTDFGSKESEFYCDGDTNTIPKEDFEVFYLGTEKNHPGGNATDPNWYHYYRQNEGGTDYTYDSTIPNSTTVSGVPNSTHIADTAYEGGFYLETQIINNRLMVTGQSQIYKRYRYFYSVVVHERHHANNELTIANSVPPQDNDQDSLPNDYETNVTKTDPSPGGAYSASPQYRDDEAYAGGPIEEAANKAADTSSDWANPGTNCKNQ